LREAWTAADAESLSIAATASRASCAAASNARISALRSAPASWIAEV
jgi:hypothetical protein